MSEEKKRGRPPKSTTVPASTNGERHVEQFSGTRERPSRKRPDIGNSLYAPQRQGYQRYWAIDRPGEIEKMEARDWTFVLNESGEKIRTPAGQGNWHYLMEIPQEWYNQDMEELAKRSSSYDVETNETLPANEYVPMGHQAVVTRK